MWKEVNLKRPSAYQKEFIHTKKWDRKGLRNTFRGGGGGGGWGEDHKVQVQVQVQTRSIAGRPLADVWVGRGYMALLEWEYIRVLSYWFTSLAKPMHNSGTAHVTTSWPIYLPDWVLHWFPLSSLGSALLLTLQNQLPTLFSIYVLIGLIDQFIRDSEVRFSSLCWILVDIDKYCYTNRRALSI